MNLEECLRRLHRMGYWIEAWYPLANGTFECRISGGEWGVDPQPLVALQQAMQKAGIYSNA